MPRKIFRPTRFAMLLEIIRRCAKQPTQVGNFSGDQARLANWRRMHCDIESAFDKIVAAKRKIIEHQVDIEMRIGRGETRDRVAERQRGQRFWRKNLERAGGLLLRPFERSFLFFGFLNDPLAKIKMRRPGLG